MSWPLVDLGSVAYINPRLPKDTDDSQVVTFLKMASVSEGGELLEQEKRILSETKKGFTYFEKDDVLLAKITPCFENGKSALLDDLETQLGFGSTEFHVLRAVEGKLDSKYLFHLVWNEEFRFLGKHAMKGAAGQQRISTDFLKNLKIPLPPLETQKQIAAVLEKADQLRKDCQQMEQELNSLAQSVFIDMFGDPVTNPKGWDVIPCKTLCEKITVGVVVQPASYYVGNGVPALRSLNVRENKLSEDKMMYFSKEAHTKQLAKSQIFEGDVLIVRSGQPGRAAVVTKKFDNCNCIDVLIARPNANVLESQYLSFFLNSEGGRKLVLKEERGQVQKHLNVKVLNEALIPCPPIEKQRQFIDVYNILLEELNNTLLLIEHQDGLFNALMQKAFKGELNL